MIRSAPARRSGMKWRCEHLLNHEPTRRIPKGFRNKAQGCEERATLGSCVRSMTTLKGLRPTATTARQGRNPVGVVKHRPPLPRVRACPTESFVANFVANFVENRRKSTRFATKFATKEPNSPLVGQALARPSQPWAFLRNPF